MGASDERAVRVFISYAHGDEGHEEQVLQLWALLCRSGIDARVDKAVEGERLNRAEWAATEIREATYVRMVASSRYRERAEGGGRPPAGRGPRS